MTWKNVSLDGDTRYEWTGPSGTHYIAERLGRIWVLRYRDKEVAVETLKEAKSKASEHESFIERQVWAS